VSVKSLTSTPATIVDICSRQKSMTPGSLHVTRIVCQSILYGSMQLLAVKYLEGRRMLIAFDRVILDTVLYSIVSSDVTRLFQSTIWLDSIQLHQKRVDLCLIFTYRTYCCIKLHFSR
jgi:hypothetical protein